MSDHACHEFTEQSSTSRRFQELQQFPKGKGKGGGVREMYRFLSETLLLFT